MKHAEQRNKGIAAKKAARPNPMGPFQDRDEVFCLVPFSDQVGSHSGAR
jgi:hypothetical protein